MFKKLAILALALTFSLPLMASDEKDVFSGNYFWYYDKMDRSKIFQSLMDSIELDYALLPLKETRLGLDFAKLNSDTLAYEQSLPETSDAFEQARSNIRFIDRVKAYVAKFQDTHFGIGTTTAMPVIFTGIRTTPINGKVYVTALDSKILAYIAKRSDVADFSAIAVGDEIVKVDGKPVSKAVDTLSQFVSGSSQEFINLRAVSGLTVRNYAYPEKNYVDFTFAKGVTLRFPWFYSTSGMAVRPDINFYFKNVGFINDSSVNLNWDSVRKDWVESSTSYAGYSSAAIAPLLTDVKNYTASAFGTVIRTGYFTRDNKTYAVLQLLTFQEANVKGADGVEKPFLDVVSAFVAEIKAKNLSLIFDLRNNNGGNGSFPPAILSYLTEAGKVYANRTSGYRITEYMRQLQEPDFYKEFPAEDLSGNGITNDQFTEMFLTAIRERATYSPMYSASDIYPSAKINGYEGKIVALVTSNCISACDNMSNLLKNNKRAILIGTHSNGTGAGFSSDDRLNTKWTDPRHVLSTTIPNYVFGKPGGEAGTGVYVFEKDSVERLCSENRPHQADVIYTTQLKDVSGNSIGWFEKAVQILEAN